MFSPPVSERTSVLLPNRSQKRKLSTGMLALITLLSFAISARAENTNENGANRNASVPSDVIVHENQFYGPIRKPGVPPKSRGHNRSFCDVYLPAQKPPTTDQTTVNNTTLDPLSSVSSSSVSSGHPVVIVVHGGAWASGDKWTLQNYSRKLARAGIAAVTINYRLAPKFKFPSQADDVRQAMFWVAQHAEEFALDTNRLGLCGYSAGGHLSLLIGALADEPMKDQILASEWSADDPRWARLPKVAAVCAGGPYCDFESLPIDNTAMAYFLNGSRRQKSEMYRAASPISFVTKSDPTTMIIHGDADILVPIRGARRFHQKQKEEGVETSMTEMPKQGHMMTFLNPRTSDLFVEFFVRQFLANESQ